jgi:hypothetical protein
MILISFVLNPVDNDLHDLHDLRTRFLLFIHSLLESLRATGVCLVALSYAKVLNLFTDSCLLRASSVELTAVLSLRFASRFECVQSKDCRHSSLPECTKWQKVRIPTSPNPISEY